MARPLDYQSARPSHPMPDSTTGRRSFGFAAAVSVLLGSLVTTFVATEPYSPLRVLAVVAVFAAGSICSIIAIVMGVIGVHDGGIARKWAIASFALTLLNGVVVIILLGMSV